MEWIANELPITESDVTFQVGTRGLVQGWTISLVCALPRVESRGRPRQKTPLPAEGTLTNARKVGCLGHRLVLGKEVG